MLRDHQFEYHNISEMPVSLVGPGRRLQRLPESVREFLNPTARLLGLSPTQAEIRFVCDGEVDLTFHSEIHHEYFRIYQGDFFQQEICIEPGQTRTISVRQDARLVKNAAALRPDSTRGFSPEMMRVRMSGTGRISFVHGEAHQRTIRPPTAEEKPTRTLLGYGSSITQGFNASRMGVTYLAQAAKQLGMDFLNLGSGGSCFCESEMGTYLAGRDDWDVALLELGINLLGCEPAVSDEEFRELAYGIIEPVSRDPKRQVAVVTLFPAGHDLPDSQRFAEPFREILRDHVKDLARSNVHLIEGSDVALWDDLSADLCHPSDVGQAAMGLRLAEIFTQRKI
ncbi:MAG: hypothetical protein EAZ42_12980 [Verrucomicrobia bacterium]|nr:MAG: hypothetical protein EAZ42_12980 [Verrucomicrobiota bacterium]